MSMGREQSLAVGFHVYPCKHLKFCNDKELSPSSARPCYVCFYGPQKDLLSAFGIAAECFLSHGESFASVLLLSVCLIAVRNLCCASEEAQKQDFCWRRDAESYQKHETYRVADHRSMSIPRPDSTVLAITWTGLTRGTGSGG